jgi:hypothetical protein
MQQKLIARIEALVRPDCRWLGYWSLGSALQAA